MVFKKLEYFNKPDNSKDYLKLMKKIYDLLIKIYVDNNGNL
jgi:hypothetical protein